MNPAMTNTLTHASMIIAWLGSYLPYLLVIQAFIQI